MPIRHILFVLLASTLAGCAPGTEAPSGPGGDKGYGPVQSVTLAPTVDAALAAKGRQVFDQKCTACHKMESRHIGPALAGVTTRRKPEWIMNMMLNPIEMTRKDEVAKALLAEYMTRMSDMALTQDDARAVYEHLRDADQPKKK